MSLPGIAAHSNDCEKTTGARAARGRVRQGQGGGTVNSGRRRGRGGRGGAVRAGAVATVGGDAGGRRGRLGGGKA